MGGRHDEMGRASERGWCKMDEISESSSACLWVIGERRAVEAVEAVEAAEADVRFWDVE